MKKVLAIFAIVALASCSNGTSTEGKTDSTAVAVDTVNVDSSAVSVDSTKAETSAVEVK
jgi:hypothetical protein